jgi:hypothetical protein
LPGFVRVGGDVGHDCLLACLPHEIRSRITSATRAGEGVAVLVG